MDSESVFVCFFAEPEHVLPEVWVAVVDVEVEDHGVLGDASDFAEPTERLGNLGVVERTLEDAVTCSGHSFGDAD